MIAIEGSARLRELRVERRPTSTPCHGRIVVRRAGMPEAAAAEGETYRDVEISVAFAGDV